MIPSRLDEDSWSFYDQLGIFPKNNIVPKSRPPPWLFPRAPAGQTMTIARDSCCRRVLRGLRVLHRVLPCASSRIPRPPSTCREEEQQPQLPSTHHRKFISFFVPVRSGRSVLPNKNNCIRTARVFMVVWDLFFIQKTKGQGQNAWNPYVRTCSRKKMIHQLPPAVLGEYNIPFQPL